MGKGKWWWFFTRDLAWRIRFRWHYMLWKRAYKRRKGLLARYNDIIENTYGVLDGHDMCMIQTLNEIGDEQDKLKYHGGGFAKKDTKER